ncbi:MULTISPECIES: hypothetical protein [Bacillus]|uniref:hypothetical protein n=1 Tax=Bacillus TaxID=1386 RepID=UPI001483B15F|nr:MULTISPECIES: hypothetical protein [Bacillus]
MNTGPQEQIEEARETYVGRLFLLGGSALFLIGGIISAVAAYKTYFRLLNTPPSQ